MGVVSICHAVRSLCEQLHAVNLSDEGPFLYYFIHAQSLVNCPRSRLKASKLEGLIWCYRMVSGSIVLAAVTALNVVAQYLANELHLSPFLSLFSLNLASSIFISNAS